MRALSPHRAEAITLADDQLGGAGGGMGGAGGVGGFGEWGGMGDLADLEQHMLVLPTAELMKGFRVRGAVEARRGGASCSDESHSPVDGRGLPAGVQGGV